MTDRKSFPLSVTTQGPTYPPSEVMNADGDFVVIGRVNRRGPDGQVVSQWGDAIVSPDSPVPPFGTQYPFEIVRELELRPGSPDLDMVLYTLPLPLPTNNYPVVFAPEQLPQPQLVERPSYAFHDPRAIPDLRLEDGPREMAPVTLGQWIKARGEVKVTLSADRRSATFDFDFEDLVPDTLYTVMSLREKDLDPVHGPTRPGPLGIPDVFMTDGRGRGRFWARLPNPFPGGDKSPTRNRIVNVILLWMCTRMSYGGALGLHGLGGDVHAQLKLKQPSFFEFETRA